MKWNVSWRQGAHLSADGRGAKGCLLEGPVEVCLARDPDTSGGLAWREPIREPKPSAELPLPPTSGVALLLTCVYIYYVVPSQIPA